MEIKNLGRALVWKEFMAEVKVGDEEETVNISRSRGSIVFSFPGGVSYSVSLGSILEDVLAFREGEQNGER